MGEAGCSFCSRSGTWCTLRHGTAAICGTCTTAYALALGWIAPPPSRKEQLGLLFRGKRAWKPVPSAHCSFCGRGADELVEGHERFHESELVVAFGAPVWLCRACLERGVASLPAS